MGTSWELEAKTSITFNNKSKPISSVPFVSFSFFVSFCPSTARASSVPTRTKDNRRGRGSATQVFQRCGVSESKSSPSVKSSCFRQLSPSQDLTNHGKTHSVNMKAATLQSTRENKNKDGSGEGLFFENTAILSVFNVSICIKLKLYMYLCYNIYLISGKPVRTADCQALLLDKQIKSLQRY